MALVAFEEPAQQLQAIKEDMIHMRARSDATVMLEYEAPESLLNARTTLLNEIGTFVDLMMERLKPKPKATPTSDKDTMVDAGASPESSGGRVQQVSMSSEPTIFLED